MADNDRLPILLWWQAFGNYRKTLVTTLKGLLMLTQSLIQSSILSFCYKTNELQNVASRRSFTDSARDGLMLLVMSYTKKEAMRIKIAYNQRFQLDVRHTSGWYRQFEEKSEMP